MEHGACNVIYVDKRARDELVRKDLASQTGPNNKTRDKSDGSETKVQHQQPAAEIAATVTAILMTFNEGAPSLKRAYISCCTVY